MSFACSTLQPNASAFFRALSSLPDSLEPLRASFYPARDGRAPVDDVAWGAWLDDWRAAVSADPAGGSEERAAAHMRSVNPKYLLREWQLVPAYQAAMHGDYALVRELQAVMTQPYAEQDEKSRFATLKPQSAFGMGGVSHMSCSS